MARAVEFVHAFTRIRTLLNERREQVCAGVGRVAPSEARKKGVEVLLTRFVPPLGLSHFLLSLGDDQGILPFQNGKTEDLCQVFMVCRLLSVGAQQLERWGSVVLAESDQEDVKKPPGCMFTG